MEFQDRLLQLRMVTRHDAISRELWVRSRHGTWRFFRLAGERLVELDRAGQTLTDKPAAGQ
jgi:hypothetical protein